MNSREMQIKEAYIRGVLDTLEAICFFSNDGKVTNGHNEGVDLREHFTPEMMEALAARAERIKQRELLALVNKLEAAGYTVLPPCTSLPHDPASGPGFGTAGGYR